MTPISVKSAEIGVIFIMNFFRRIAEALNID